MKNSVSWKTLIVGAAIAGMSLVGAGTAAAETTNRDSNGGASLIRTETTGSTLLWTAPRHRTAQWGYIGFGSPYDTYYGSYYYGSND
ncbi:MAG: hypothetical protein AB7G47_01800 [Mycolicibacterium sp.]|uniref:hypothetical protein n=1 Tax=Mycolicibacterium sp. TaxID=2320850 RepID=UPI003D0F749A